MLKHFVVASVVVAGLASGTPSFAASDKVAVNVEPAASMDLVLYVEGRVGQLLTTTDRTGKGTFNPDVANIVKGRRFQVRKCGDRLGLVADGSQAPANCQKDKLAAYAWGQDETLKVKLSGAGMSDQMKTTIIAAAAGAGAYIAKETLRGGARSMQQVEQERRHEEVVSKPPEPTEQPKTEQPKVEEPKQPDPPKPPVEERPDLTMFSGSYTGGLPAVTNTCNYAPVTSMKGDLNVDKTGRGTWQSTHTNANVTLQFAPIVLEYNASTQTARFQAETSRQIGSRLMNVTDIVTLTASKAAVSQILRSAAGDCAVEYAGTLAK